MGRDRRRAVHRYARQRQDPIAELPPCTRRLLRRPRRIAPLGQSRAGGGPAGLAGEGSCKEREASVEVTGCVALSYASGSGFPAALYRSIASSVTRRASSAPPHVPTRTHFIFSRSL